MSSLLQQLEAASMTAKPVPANSMNRVQRKEAIMEYLNCRNFASRKEIREMLGDAGKRTVDIDMQQLMDENKVKKSGYNQYYRVCKTIPKKG